jgi:hypothetical protein
MADIEPSLRRSGTQRTGQKKMAGGWTARQRVHRAQTGTIEFPHLAGLRVIQAVAEWWHIP